MSEVKNKVLRKSATFQASAAEVWRAITDPEKIKQWLFGTTTISDWKKGSPIRFTGEWNGQKYDDGGVITAFEPNKRFQYTYWSAFSGLPDAQENHMLITFDLEPSGKGTLLKLSQENFANETQFEHSDKGWEGAIDIIRKMLEP